MLSLLDYTGQIGLNGAFKILYWQPGQLAGKWFESIWRHVRAVLSTCVAQSHSNFFKVEAAMKE